MIAILPARPPLLRWSYRLKQNGQGRYCLLTRDCVALATALGQPTHNYGSASSDEKFDPEELHARLGIEESVTIEVTDVYESRLKHLAGLRQLYPFSNDDELIRLGFEDVLLDAAFVISTGYSLPK